MFTNKRAPNCSNAVMQKLQALIADSLSHTLLENRVPPSVADKLSRQVLANVNVSALYEIIAKDIQNKQRPKQRILDRAIVHMFEILYCAINEQDKRKAQIVQQDFFKIVPRGECLDLFLQLVKKYCMGDDEIAKYTFKLGPMIEQYRSETMINWQDLYKSPEFKVYLTGLLNLILLHLREDQKPIPALENKIPVKYHPYRINSFLNQICLLRKNQKI